MEESKLNLSSPLLSVRRFSKPAHSSLEKGMTFPNPLPNRRRTNTLGNSDSNMDQVTEPVAVPFTWEDIPGKAKDGHRKKELLLLEGPPVTPRISLSRPSKLGKMGQAEEAKFDRKFNGYEEETVDAERDHSEDDGDNDTDAYSDAAETLSTTESVSFSVNYSVSGLSGSDGPVVKPSGTFSVDSQTQELMMSRFLPAARAMAVESPQYAASRKQPVSVEQPREVKKLLIGDSKPPPKQYSMEIEQYYRQDTWKDESEDEDDEDNDVGDMTAKGCGLLPRLCLLNPIPGFKSRAPSPISSRSRIKGPGEDAHALSANQPISKKEGHKHKFDHDIATAKNSTPGSSSRYNFSGELRTRGVLSPLRHSRNDGFNSQPKERAPPPYRGHNFSGELRTRGALSPLRHSLNDGFTSQPKEQAPPPYIGRNFSGELRTRSAFSPLRHSRNDGFTPQHKEQPPSPSGGTNFSGELRSRGGLSPLRRSWNDGFTSQPKEQAPLPFGGYNFSGDLRSRGGLSPLRCSQNDGFTSQQKEQAPSPSQPKERPTSPFGGFKSLGMSKEVKNIEADHLNLLLRQVKNMQSVSLARRKNQASGTSSPVVEKTLYVDTVNTDTKSSPSSNYRDVEEFNRVREDADIPFEKKKTRDNNTVEESPFQDIVCVDAQKSGTRSEHYLSGPIRAELSSLLTASLKGQQDSMLVSADEYPNGNKDIIVKTVDKEDNNAASLPLPSLKSPTESWLRRTLPSIPSRSTSPRLAAPYYSKKRDAKKSATDSKWETIVRTSKLHHDHVRHSQELVSRVTEQSKF